MYKQFLSCFEFLEESRGLYIELPCFLYVLRVQQNTVRYFVDKRYQAIDLS